MGLFSRKKRTATDDPTLIDAPGAPSDDAAGPDGDTRPEGADGAGGVEPTAHREDFEQLLDREWQRLANAGTWWTGGERLAVAADARRAFAGEELSDVLPPPVNEATRRIAVAPATIRADDVARWEQEGLNPFGYVEITGVVSRLMALDTASYGLGIPLRPLPTPQLGGPSRETPDDAAITTGWAPTVGPASAPASLSAVPREAEAMFDLHGVLYASMDQMFEMQLEREGLSRPQIELVAARTSSLNECFY